MNIWLYEVYGFSKCIKKMVMMFILWYLFPLLTGFGWFRLACIMACSLCKFGLCHFMSCKPCTLYAYANIHKNSYTALFSTQESIYPNCYLCVLICVWLQLWTHGKYDFSVIKYFLVFIIHNWSSSPVCFEHYICDFQLWSYILRT